MIQKLTDCDKMALNKAEKQKLVTDFIDICDSIVRDPEKLTEFAKTWNCDFWHYSIRNLLLAKFQYPEATMLAGGGKWNKEGRRINKGEKAIYIWAPNIYKDKETGETELHGFRLVPVFDVSQTNGEPLDNLGHPRLVENPEIKFEAFKKQCPYKVTVKELGEINGQTNGKDIVISPKSNEASMVATLWHEEAHIELEHKDSDISRSVREITAEAVSYIVCTFFNITHNKARYYIGSWEQHQDELRGYGWEVVRTAERIINRYKPLLEVNKTG